MSENVDTQPEGTPEVPELFNPAAYNVDEVNAYLADADADERARVIGLEDAPEGGQRKTVQRDWAEDGQEGTQEPAGDDGEPAGTSTKATTFAEAAQAIVEPPAQEGVFLTETDRLHAEGESKGLTFAEQAAEAQRLYGTGRPGDERPEPQPQD